jgi:hypothetical protein
VNGTIQPRANFTPAQIAAASRLFGKGVGPLPCGVDGTLLLWAIAGVESSFGVDCQPRHEPAYDTGGLYAKNAPMPGLLMNFGSAAACSYGPWQLMLCDAPLGFAPAQFDVLDNCARATLGDLNRKLRMFRPQTVAQIGDCWNAGHITPDPGYEAKLKITYATPMVNA